MKSVLLAGVLFASISSTAAFSKTIVEYSFATRATETNTAQVVKAAISDQGQMKLLVMRLTASVGTQSTVQINDSLSQYNFETVKSLAKVLSNAKVKTIVRPNVCMTFAAPIPQGPQSLEIATGYDYQSDSFRGALRLVKTPSDCYFRTVTAFVSQTDIAKANRLESAIEVLAHELLEANGIERN